MHRRRKVDEKSCVTLAGTSNELDVQNKWINGKKTDAVGSSWAALAAEEDPLGRGIGTLLVEAGAGGGVVGGGEGEGRGRDGGPWGRGCWTARTMGGSVGNPA